MINIKDISVGYQDKRVIQGLSLGFRTGEFCALLGPNGAGKSTLLKSILGYLELEKGEIDVENISLEKWESKELAKRISLIPQEFQLQFDYAVFDLVLMGRFPYLGYWQNYSREDREITLRVLEQLDLLEMKNKYLSQLSGGEKKRVSIARALVQETDAILMDEAFSNLDINHQIETMQLLAQINAEHNKLIIMVPHNINLASEYCDRIVMLKGGKLVADGTPEEIVSKENLRKLYNTELEIISNPVSGKPNLIYPGKSDPPTQR